MAESHILGFLNLFQKIIAKNVKISHLGLEKVGKICALDVAYNKDIGYAVALFHDLSTNTFKYNVAKGKVFFPYIPGYLFMREAPLMIEALKPYLDECELILVDGQGLAHPRKSGIATVIGVLLEKPSIGVAKSRLTGDIVNENGVSYIIVNGEKVGVKSGKYYYSIGNLVDLQDVIYLASKGYPIELKKADKISKESKRNE
ncbi:MAG: endonuclease V [Sulfolobaceae archaeon]|nr:endonuclease V [Sulfolobaceae archaeon]